MQDFLQSLNINSNTPLLICIFFGMVILFSGFLIDIFIITRNSWYPQKWIYLIKKIRNRPWTWRDGSIIVLTILTSYLIIILITLLSPNATIETNSKLYFVLMIIQTLMFQGAGLIVVMFLMKLHNISWLDGFGIRKKHFLKNIGRGFIFYLASIPVIILSALVYKLILIAFRYPIEPQPVILILGDANNPVWFQIYIAILAIMVAPVIEELIFRGIMLSLISKFCNIKQTICFTSIIFAVIHFHIPSIMPLFVMSVALSTAYIYSKSILVPIIMHSLFNGINLIAFFMLKDIIN